MDQVINSRLRRALIEFDPKLSHAGNLSRAINNYWNRKAVQLNPDGSVRYSNIVNGVPKDLKLHPDIVHVKRNGRRWEIVE